MKKSISLIFLHLFLLFTFTPFVSAQIVGGNIAETIQNALDYVDMRENGDKSGYITGAETEAAQAAKEEYEVREQLAALNGELQKAEGDSAELKQQIENLKVTLAEKEAKRIEAAEKLQNAYKRLAAVYEKAGKIGDPVLIGTGDYIYTKEDFCAQDFLKKFSVSRTLSNSSYSESFGKVWTCSLDTRIVRGRREDVSELIAIYESELDYLSQQIELMEEYNHKWTKYQKFLSDLQDLKSQKKEIEKYIEEMKKISLLNNQIDELNKYTTYGYFQENKFYISDFDILIFTSSEGLHYKCKYQSKGKWIPETKNLSENFYIQSLNENGKIDDTPGALGGFQIVYTNGEICTYSKYGLLEKITDRNQNTTSFNSQKGFIQEIVNKTGEVIYIERNNLNHIIKVHGKTSGETLYMYLNNFIDTVIFNDKLTESYTYNSNGKLKSIITGPNESINIEYEYYSDFQKDMVSSVTNQIKETETFFYNKKQNSVTHITYTGNTEVFQLDASGATISSEDEFGNLRKYAFNKENLITSVYDKGSWKYFTYDEASRPVKISFEDGSNATTEYNQFGEIIFQSDRDGFTNSFSTDSKGNITEIRFCDLPVSKLTYYENGLIKTLLENENLYEYEYNKYGSITKKTLTDSKGTKLTEIWSYDSKNRLINYKKGQNLEISYEHEDFTLCEITKDKKITHFYDFKNRETQTIEEELNSGTVYDKKIIYDEINRPKEIYLNNHLYKSFEYALPWRMTACTIWDLKTEGKGIKLLYSFDSFYRLISESRLSLEKESSPAPEKLYSLEYNQSEEGMTVTVYQSPLVYKKYVYNKENLLTQISSYDGSLEERTYTKAGRLSSIISKNTQRDFSYFNDGRVSITETHENGFQSVYIYNSAQQLIYKTDPLGNSYAFFYDSLGRLEKENGPAFYSNFSYTDEGFLHTKELFSNSGELCYECEYQYDLDGRNLKKVEGHKYISEYNYDAWSRLIKSHNSNGIHYYEYDILGNCIAEKNTDGLQKEFDYNPLGLVEKKSVDRTPFEEKIYSAAGNLLFQSNYGRQTGQWEYNDSNLLTKSSDYFGNLRQNSYNEDFSQIQSFSNDTGTIQIYKDNRLNQILIKNEKGFSYTETYDSLNNLINETYNTGFSIQYNYDSNGKLLSKTDSQNQRQNYTYDYSNNKSEYTYNQETYSVKKNPLGFITEISNPEGTIYYIYDTGGKLIQIKDEISNTSVYYDYDKYGSCISKKGDFFDFSYNYNPSGLISGISDSISNSAIALDYDNFGREIKRTFSNGSTIYTAYNSSGQICSSIAKEPYGIILEGEIYLYDASGKKTLTFDNKGLFKKYSYDSHGHLIKIEVPYETGIINRSKEEAYECGLYIQEEAPQGKSCSLSSSEYRELTALCRENNFPLPSQFPQYSWFEEYTYSEEGNLIQLHNPFGTIRFSYDSNNRLISKQGINTNTEGIKYFWTQSGNLKEVVSRFQHMYFTYGAFNRPNSIKTENYITGNISIAFYTYDALGRRLSENIEQGTNHHFFYDGLSYNLLLDTPVFSNKVTVLSYSVPQKNHEIEDETYRTLSPEAYAPFEELKLHKNDTKPSPKKITFEDRPVISCNLGDNTAFYIYGDNTFSSHGEFLIHNESFTSIRAVLDQQGNLIKLPSCDIWGNPLAVENITNKNLQFSRAKNTLRTPNLIFDLGNRDYLPSMRCFISQDPEKAGFNWYAYCPTDPVNYFDSMGLQKQGLTPKEEAEYRAGMAGVMTFNHQEYTEKGSSAGIDIRMDCADVSATSDAIAAQAAGVSGYSKKATQFQHYLGKDDVGSAKETINSWTFFDGTNHESVTQTSSGFDRDAYYAGDSQAAKDRVTAYENLQDSGIVTPGTVLVWKKSDYGNQESKWIGHTMTVLAREFDANGNIIGFAFIEGHTGGGKTTIGYMSTQPGWKEGVENIDWWIGNYLGTFEIESSTPHGCNSRY